LKSRSRLYFGTRHLSARRAFERAHKLVNADLLKEHGWRIQSAANAISASEYIKYRGNFTSSMKTPRTSFRLAADLDKVVSSHLAKMDFRGDLVVSRPIALNPEWLGIWIRDHRLGEFVNVPVREVPSALSSLKQQIAAPIYSQYRHSRFGVDGRLV
jgi:hypothetical protein